MERQWQCKLNGLIFHLMLDFNKFSISKKKKNQMNSFPNYRQIVKGISDWKWCNDWLRGVEPCDPLRL